MVFRTSQMSTKMFHSLSDETKIKMHTQQFCILSDQWDEIDAWVDENIFGSYHIETEAVMMILCGFYYMKRLMR